MTARVFGAIDIGASGGRVIGGVIHADGATTLNILHRFPNSALPSAGHLRWNLTALYGEVLTGLGLLAQRYPQVESIGIDTWAVDYGLLDTAGELLAEPISYRDQRTAQAVARVHERVSRDALYAVNGLQYLPFNTLYQLEAERASAIWEKAAHVVLLPDLLAYWLTGALATEATNASTTGLLDVHTGAWSPYLLRELGIDPARLPTLEAPGTVRGQLTPKVARQTGLGRDTVVTTVGSHDTASAVVAVPATGRNFAYVSSGTWSLAGLEVDTPITTAESQQLNFTNEGGVDGRIRFLRNVGGLWLLQECLREWDAQGLGLDLAPLLAEAETLPTDGPTVDVDEDRFIPAGPMTLRIAQAVSERGQRVPAGPAETVRCILDSLASAYARTMAQAATLAHGRVDTVHIVGGGSQNRLLCQLTADLSGLPVVAGPVEATALGNVLVQARAHGAAPATLEEMRLTVAASQPLRRYEPL
ncbi:MAG TPA: rhamnulokinase family protein [Pedococcus sp.]|jgi:rhamnulokinase|nr:rhamnulokinase family protein [Pedococcus sp.]